jgi:uncharacterized protein YdcH (DUF465 family)
MSGLIWGGIGQGIANAGQTIGGMMMKDIEYQRQLQAEDRKETNYLKRLEEAQRIKDEAAEVKAEALQQRVIKETTAAQAAGAEAPGMRMAGQLKTVQGQIEGESPAMSEAELQQLIKDNPQYKKIYEEAGYVTKKDERLERSEGAIASAMAAGAHSTTIGNLQKQRAAVLDEIKQEFKETKDAKDRAETNRRLDQTDERLTQTGKTVEIMARNATTAETRAAKDSNARSARETTMDLQRKVDVARDTLAEKLGVSTNNLNEELARLQKRAATNPKDKEKLEGLQSARDAVTAARDRLTAWEAKGGSDTAPAAPAPGGGAKPAAEKAPPKPDIASVKGVPPGSSVGNFVAGRGYEVKDRTGKVLGYVGK